MTSLLRVGCQQCPFLGHSDSCINYCNALLCGTFIGIVPEAATGAIALELKELQCLTISYRALFNILLLTQKALKNSGLRYLKDCLLLHGPVRSLRSSRKLLVMAVHPTQYYRVETKKLTFSALALVLCAICKAVAISCFRYLVKTYCITMLWFSLMHKILHSSMCLSPLHCFIYSYMDTFMILSSAFKLRNCKI